MFGEEGEASVPREFCSSGIIAGGIGVVVEGMVHALINMDLKGFSSSFQRRFVGGNTGLDAGRPSRPPVAVRSKMIRHTLRLASRKHLRVQSKGVNSPRPVATRPHATDDHAFINAPITPAWTAPYDSIRTYNRVILHVNWRFNMTKTIAKVLLMTLLASAAVACAAAPEKAPITRKG